VAGLATPESIIVPDKMLASAGIEVQLGEVVAVARQEKRVRLADGREFPYDKLFLATGAESFIPPIPGSDLAGVLSLRGVADAARITAYLAEQRPERVVFIGAGFISLEVASLLAAGSTPPPQITLVELMNRPLPLMLDEDMAEPVATYLREKGLQLLTGEKVERIVGENGRVCAVELASGKVVPAGMVFMNVGVRPNTRLAEEMGLEIGRFGIRVNEFQETSDPDILAGGDCVEKTNVVTGKAEGGRLRGPAVIQGRLAAKRLAGYAIPFPGVLNAGGCQMFEMVVTATGISELDAKYHGFDPICAVVDSRSKHGMIPGVRPWKLKLIFDRASEKLLGGQIVSHSVAPAREIDAISAFILCGRTIAELTTFTSACNPDISSEPSAEPIAIAAEQALQKLRRR
jgi:NADH oxidase (H2O2-forming)